MYSLSFLKEAFLLLPFSFLFLGCHDCEQHNIQNCLYADCDLLHFFYVNHVDALLKIQKRAERTRDRSLAGNAHMQFIARRIASRLEDPAVFEGGDLTVPPGSPI